jgi:hypothetical protein
MNPEDIPVEYGGELNLVVTNNNNNENDHKCQTTGTPTTTTTTNAADCWGVSMENSELEVAMRLYVHKLNSGLPLPRPPHFRREDVLEEFRGLEFNDQLWEGEGEDDGRFKSDIHLPRAEQRSYFALEVSLVS